MQQYHSVQMASRRAARWRGAGGVIAVIIYALENRRILVDSYMCDWRVAFIS